MIRWSEDGPSEAIYVIEFAMKSLGTDDPATVAGHIDRLLNQELVRWAMTGKARRVEALFIAWTMLRFHVLAAAARSEADEVGIEQREAVEEAIRRIRESARQHQDWGLAWQQLAAELASIIDTQR